MKRRLRLVRQGDRGASLVLALVFITVLSLVLMSVFAFADTSMLATIKLRSQTSESAAAEGAAQAAINALRKNGYNGNSAGCFGGATTLYLNKISLPSGQVCLSTRFDGP